MTKHLKLAANAFISGIFLYVSIALGVGIDPLDNATMLGNALAPTFGQAGESAWVVISVILFLVGIWQTIRLIRSYWELPLLDKFCTFSSFIGAMLLFWQLTSTAGAYLIATGLIIAAFADGLSTDRRRR